MPSIGFIILLIQGSLGTHLYITTTNGCLEVVENSACVKRTHSKDGSKPPVIGKVYYLVVSIHLKEYARKIAWISSPGKGENKLMFETTTQYIKCYLHLTKSFCGFWNSLRLDSLKASAFFHPLDRFIYTMLAIQPPKKGHMRNSSQHCVLMDHITSYIHIIILCI